MRIARAVVLGVALVACAWFALGIHQAHDMTVAQGIIDGQPAVTPALAAKASSLLTSAATLNPDRQVALLRSQLALREGDYRRAVALAQQVTREEPQNVSAWLELATAGYDNATPFLPAVQKIEQLDPQLGHVRP